MYRYLNIRGESDYSKFLPVEDIFSCIANIPELSQLSDRSFESVAGAPWFLVSIISCSSTGCYPGRTSHTSKTANLIEFICSDDNFRKRFFYERLALGVAKSLDWEVVDANSSEVIREIESE